MSIKQAFKHLTVYTMAITKSVSSYKSVQICDSD